MNEPNSRMDTTRAEPVDESTLDSDAYDNYIYERYFSDRDEYNDGVGECSDDPTDPCGCSG